MNDPGGSVDGTGGANAVADQVVAEIKAAGGKRLRVMLPSLTKKRLKASSIRPYTRGMPGYSG